MRLANHLLFRHHTRYHIRSSDRPYKCDECGHGFLHKKDLDRHMPRHTGQKLFRCSVPSCTKTYTRKDNLSRHMRHDHAGGASMLPVAAAEEYIPADSPNDVSDHSARQVPLAQTPETESAPTPTAAEEYQPMEVDGQRSFNQGKRPAEEELGRSNELRAAKRPPRKSPLKHRLACPYRKCQPERFSAQPRYKVCATTPHEYIRRVIDHMDRNHQISVCGGCFLAFSTPEYLKQHKDSAEHCGKCYLSFPNKTTIAAHAPLCRSVESSTQEDVWHIMYETLCGDYARHNPSFDDDGAVDQTILQNNLARMRYIDEHPKLPGQVGSLYKEHMPVSGNGNAPAAMNSHELVPAAVGAFPLPAAGSSTSELQHLRAQVRQLHVREQERQVQVHHQQQAIAFLVDVEARQAKRIAAIEKLLLPTTSALPSTIELSPNQDLDSLQASTRFRPHSVISNDEDLLVARPQPLSFANQKSSYSNVVTPYSTTNPSWERHAVRCPSLTSDSTAPTQNFEIPTSLPRYTLIGGEDPNISIKDREQSFQLAWGSTFEDEFITLEDVHVVEPTLGVDGESAQDQEHACPSCGDKTLHVGKLCAHCFSLWPPLEGT
jgi:hypothetical protein